MQSHEAQAWLNLEASNDVTSICLSSSLGSTFLWVGLDLMKSFSMGWSLTYLILTVTNSIWRNLHYRKEPILNVLFLN